jgi:tRNA/tmRNA/rRNA uracil-C5-methylase (TrmA/RlmC/RlmD family)
VIAQCAQLKPRAIVYVACDPAALARDTSYLRDAGYQLEAMRAFDLFPMTHHIESIAKFVPTKVS